MWNLQPVQKLQHVGHAADENTHPVQHGAWEELQRVHQADHSEAAAWTAAVMARTCHCIPHWSSTGSNMSWLRHLLALPLLWFYGL